LSHFSSVFYSQITHLLRVSNLGRWLVGLILLFLSSQTAGLLHAEIHPFHKHTSDCEQFEQLAQPADSGYSYSFGLFKLDLIIPYVFALISVFHEQFFAHFFCRAPPISL